MFTGVFCLSVIVGPNAPKIRLKTQSLVTVKLGESAKLSCQATGEPAPRIMWISPRKDVIAVSSDKFQIMDGGMLVVKKVTLADEGKYACVARNSAGDDIKNMKVEAEPQEPFINGMKGKSTTKALGVSYQTALLDCRVEGKPEPRVWWVTPYGHSLTTPYLGGRFQVHRNGSLELRGVRKTDEGRYTCLAKNHLGEASLLVELEVASLGSSILCLCKKHQLQELFSLMRPISNYVPTSIEPLQNLFVAGLRPLSLMGLSIVVLVRIRV
uniref:Ig-like domain-containing protein n=1 Tax=Stegastes partitus TaxID=144197 RepID=A0A3B4ZFF5_9TELE